MSTTVPDTIQLGRHTYPVGDKIAEGDLADIYRSTYTNGSESKIVLKVCRDKADNDLLESEANILRFLYPRDAKDEKFYRYLPKVVDAGHLKDQRHVLVVPEMVEYISLADIIRAYPGGIDFRDAAWMYKRMLACLGFVNAKGVIHGAILPPHVLVHPTGHGAKIIDWAYALNFAYSVKPKNDPTPAAPHTHNIWDEILHGGDAFEDPPSSPAVIPTLPKDPKNQYIRAISLDHEAFYPPEVFERMPPRPGTDLFMAAKCMVALLGGDVSTGQLPKSVVKSLPEVQNPDRVRESLQAFLQSCLLAAVAKRPRDAFQVHEDFDKLLLSLVGQNKYRPFALPKPS